MKLPSKKQWLQIFNILSKKERIAFLVFIGLFLTSSLFLLINFYLKNTEVKEAPGGTYTEGVVGFPRFINPVYAQSSDVDRDLVELIFSGIMKYDDQGQLIYDLAQSIEEKDDGETYVVKLKENVLWHDNEPLTASDVIFTIKTIQNADYKSPLRGNYLGIDAVKIDDYTLHFKLKNVYSGFLERLTFKIMPEHIWQDISPQNFLLTNYNLNPIGSGPYQFKRLKQTSSNTIISLDLVKSDKYYDANLKKPYLSRVSFRFFEEEKDLVDAARRGEVDGFSLTSPGYFELFERMNFYEYSIAMPRYFALFFNADKSRLLSDENVRKALNYATNKQEIITQVLLDRAQVVDSPILPEIYNYQSPSQVYEFNQEQAETLLADAGLEKKQGNWVKVNKQTITEFKSDLKVSSKGAEVTALQTCLAKDFEVYPEGKVTGYFGSQTKAAVVLFQEKYSDEILDPWGFTKGTGLVRRTTREKLNELCLEEPEETQVKFVLVTVNDPILEEVASQIKNQWQSLGIELEIESYPISQLEKDFIKPRNYEMLLFGEVLTIIPDPYPFWHSSQIRDPGLNLAKYESNKADNLLEDARTMLDEQARAEKYQQFQDILIADAPSLFLYSPDYVYFVSKKIKGIQNTMIVDPSKRFSNITDWHIKTSRIWK